MDTYEIEPPRQKQQWRDCRCRTFAAFAELAGYEVVGTHKETASGIRLDRAEQRKVMALVQGQRINAVLVTELSR